MIKVYPITLLLALNPFLSLGLSMMAPTDPTKSPHYVLELPTRQRESTTCASVSRRGCKETRRFFLQKFSVGVGISILIVPSDAVAQENDVASEPSSRGPKSSKPYAPIEALLPATRVRVLIDRAVEAATGLTEIEKQGKKEEGNSERQLLISVLNQLLLEPQQFVKESIGSHRTTGSTWTEWATARQNKAQIEKQIEAKPLVRAVELFEQSGERRQWARLKRQETSRERSNDMRAAFNIYTKNLVFGEGYTLNASKEEKSRLIRTYDQLPDVTSVIRADLDLRDLYRNQVLTLMDDARAEWGYQERKSGGKIAAYDATELLGLLRDAQKACMEWFSFVPKDDERAALDVVLTE